MSFMGLKLLMLLPVVVLMLLLAVRKAGTLAWALAWGLGWRQRLLHGALGAPAQPRSTSTARPSSWTCPRSTRSTS